MCACVRLLQYVYKTVYRITVRDLEKWDAGVCIVHVMHTCVCVSTENVNVLSKTIFKRHRLPNIFQFPLHIRIYASVVVFIIQYL